MMFRSLKNTIKLKLLGLGLLAAVFLLAACKKDSKTTSDTNIPNQTLQQTQSFDRTVEPSGVGVSHMGGADTGGGDGLKSSPEDVYETLKKIKNKVLPLAFYRLSKMIEPVSDERIYQPQEAIPDDLKQMIKSMIEGNRFNTNTIYQDIKETTWRIVVDGPCYDRAGEPHDASEQEDGKICFSLPRLLETPKHTLEKELAALAAHEHAHRYDYWDEGVKIQNFFLRTTEEYKSFRNFVNPDSSTISKMYAELLRVRIGAQELNALLSGNQKLISKRINRIGEIDLEHQYQAPDSPSDQDGATNGYQSPQEAQVEEKTSEQHHSILESYQLDENSYSNFEDLEIPDVMICSHIGRLSGLLSNVFGGGDGLEYDSSGEGVMLPPSYWVITGRLSQRVAGAFSFCGFSVSHGYGVKADRVHIDGPYFQAVQLSDRDHLTEILGLVNTDATELYNKTKDYLYGWGAGIGKIPEDLSHTISIEDKNGQTSELPEAN